MPDDFKGGVFLKEQEFSIKICYTDDEYSIQGSRQVIEEHIKTILNELQQQIQTDDDTSPQIQLHIDRATPNTNSKNTTIIERNSIEEQEELNELENLLIHVEPNSQWLYVLCFSYYLTEHMGESFITAKSITNTYEESSQPQPSNVHLSIFQCVNKGFLKLIGTSDGQQTYQITTEGIKHIEDRIHYSKQSKQESTLAVLYETPEQKQQVESFIEQINQEEYESIKKIKSMEHKILLILYYLHKMGMMNPVRTLMIHQILIQLYQYTGVQRSIQTTLSRARPNVMKVKIDNKIHYKLTKEGIDYVENFK